MTGLDSLFRRIASEQDALRREAPTTERVLERLRDVSTPARKRTWLWPAAAAAVLALVALVVVRAGAPAPLAVKFGDSANSPLLGAWLGAPEHRSLPLEFSDGSQIELAPSSRARLLELDAAGARVELASGSVKVHVVPRAATSFRLDAGPFSVRVTGTRFELGYDPEQDLLELFLEEGEVELLGCAFGQGRKLAAGQSVRASCREGTVEVGFDRPAPIPSSRPNATFVPPPDTQALERAPAASAHPGDAAPAPPTPSWLELARRGAYREAYAAVRRTGFEAECATASADSLALLSDVARHAGAPANAERALLVLRRRFPGTDQAALAAFALGRLQFDDRRSYASAATWFETYLRERPSGPMAREALGRLLEASQHTGDTAKAHGLATRYLREYPSGPHAELASRVLSSR